MNNSSFPVWKRNGNFSECDVIGVVGFGFNSDDGHINGLFRELIEDKGKKVVIFHYSASASVKYEEKLRIPSSQDLIIENISTERKVGDEIWTKKLSAYSEN